MESQKCKICDKSFQSTFLFYKHIQSHRSVREYDLKKEKFVCQFCKKTFVSENNYKDHFDQKHKYICDKCGNELDYESYKTHNCQNDSEESETDGMTKKIPESIQQENIDGTQTEVRTKDCFKRTMVEKKFIIQEVLDPIQVIMKYKTKLTFILKDLLSKNKMIKFFITLKVIFIKHVNKSEPQIVETGFFSGTHTLLRENEVEKKYNDCAEKIFSAFDEFLKLGSGFTLKQVGDLTLRTAKYSPIPGCSFIKTPLAIRYKKAIVNIKNKDSKCFELSCLAEIHKNEKEVIKSKRRNDPKVYKKWIGKTLNMFGMSEPMQIDDIPLFEIRNELGINIFSIQENGQGLTQIYAASVKDKKIINLLKIDGEKKSHYTLITDLNKLFCSKNKRKHYCSLCLTSFGRQKGKEKLKEHVRYCSTNRKQNVKIPSKNWIEHSNFQYECVSPVIIYCDFESISQNFEEESMTSNKKESFTRRENLHVLCGYSFYIASENINIPSTNKCFTYCGEDAGKHFLLSLDREVDAVVTYIDNYEFKYPSLTIEEEKEFQNSVSCHLCKKKYKRNEIKVRNHDHITSKYLGSAHNTCNLSFRKSPLIPCFMHNFSGYDSHLLVKELSRLEEKLYIRPVAKSLEKFIAFTYKNIQFKDSYRFIPNSLNDLCEDLRLKPGENCIKFPALYKHFKKKYPHLPEDVFAMLTRKLPFPYDYLDTFDRLEEKSLPPQSSFFNKLKGETLSDDEYVFIHAIWNTFEISNLKELTMLYNEVDTLLLCDIFTHYRSFCYNLYELEAARFLTAPSLAWAAAIKLSNTRLEIPTDIKMHDMIDQGLRGGISLVRHPISTANHPELEELYDPKKPQVFLSYTDINNLYGSVMMEALPTNNFCFVKDIEGKQEDRIDFGEEVASYSTEEWEKKIMALNDNDDIGFLFKVSIQYPVSLHDFHNELPFCAENIHIKQSMLSNYQNDLAQKFDLKRNNKMTKLTLTLSDKDDYVCHFRVLKQALNHGLKLKKKPHVILQFNQAPFLKKYILLHQDLRIKTESPLTKAFCKNQNNMVFGKSCQNVRDYKDIHLTTNQNKAEKLINSPLLNSWKIYSSSFASFQLHKREVVLDKPRIVGMSILEISKTFLYQYFYGYILPKFPCTRVILTDTDSFCLSITTEKNFYDEIKNDTEVFDFSNLPSNHRCFNISKKMISGLMKDEMQGELLYQCIALRPKMYSMLSYSDKINIKRAKGVLRNIVRQKIDHNDYKCSLFQSEKYYHSGFTILHKNHDLFTANINKVSLCPYNDKLYISKTDENEFECYSFGHYKIQSLH